MGVPPCLANLPTAKMLLGSEICEGGKSLGFVKHNTEFRFNCSSLVRAAYSELHAFGLRYQYRTAVPRRVYVMYVWSSQIADSVDQPGKVANPARGQLNRECEYFPVPVHI